MFRRLDSDSTPVIFHFDGREIEARTGDSVAAALLAAGITNFRTSPESGSFRGPYCLIGNCFDCLVTVDGNPGQQACRVAVRDGMRVERQQVLPSLEELHES